MTCGSKLGVGVGRWGKILCKRRVGLSSVKIFGNSADQQMKLVKESVENKKEIVQRILAILVQVRSQLVQATANSRCHIKSQLW